MRVRVAFIVLAAAVIPAAAQPTDPSPGAKLFEEGRDLAKQGRYAEACDKFDKSYALDNGVGTELNLADCQEHLGHIALAYRMFDEAATRLAGDNRQKFARERADALAPKLGTALIKVADASAPGTSVTIAGRVVKAAPEITERVDPGPVVVRVIVPGKTTYEKTQTATAGATITFDTGAATGEVHVDTQPPPVTGGEPATERRHGRVMAAYITGAAGVATIGVGVIIGFAANSKYNTAINSTHCNKAVTPIRCDVIGYNDTRSAGNLADVGTVVGAVGLAGVVAGAILYFTAPRDVVVSPMASDHAAGVSISGRF